MVATAAIRYLFAELNTKIDGYIIKFHLYIVVIKLRYNFKLRFCYFKFRFGYFKLRYCYSKFRYLKLRYSNFKLRYCKF